MEAKQRTYGIFGAMRLQCLEAYSPEKLQRMRNEGTLDSHLKEIQEVYGERCQVICDRMMDKFKEEHDSTECLLHATTIQSQAREIVMEQIREL